ncbi:MAG: AI-2E family transporter [Candidatus Paceibacterota bacterium]|jgi:predicted PurR-regulated permease PerM
MSETPRDFRVEITAGTVVKTIFLLILTYLLFILKDIVLVILTAVVIASSIEPLTRWFVRRSIPRVFSVLIIYVLMGASLFGMFYAFVPTLLRDTSEFLGSVPEYIETVSLWNPLGTDETVQSKAVVTSLAQDLNTTRAAVQDSSDSVSLQGVLSGIDNAISDVSAGFIHSASSIFGGVVSFILIIVLSFYLAVQEDGVASFLRIVTPRKQEAYILDLWRRTQTKIGLWMQGQVVLAVLVGVLVYLGLMVLGVKNALLFAVFAAFLEMIPLFGPIIAAIPAVMSSYGIDGASGALIVGGLYLIIHQFENHLIYPLVVKKIVGVPPILVIISLLVGFKLAGFLGIILSVPLSSMLVEFIDDVHKRKFARD